MHRFIIVFLLASGCVSSSIGVDEDASRPDVPQVDVGSMDANTPDIPPPAECTVPTDCVIQAECCTECPATRDNAVSVPRDPAARDAIAPTCDEVGCPQPCALPDPNLLAGCEDQRCIVVDLGGVDPLLNACNPELAEQQCMVRGTDCCPCGIYDETNVVALNVVKDANYRTHVCEADACTSDCAPEYPGLDVTCEQTSMGGRCTVLVQE